MKNTLIQIYQQRMDKCTTEQFWAVALLAAMCGFILLQKKSLFMIPHFLVGTAVIIVTIAAALYIYSRHKIYVYYDNHFLNLVNDEEPYKEFRLLHKNNISKRAAVLSGVVFYLIVSLGMGFFTAYVCFME
jgi:hypothetical protein